MKLVYVIEGMELEGSREIESELNYVTWKPFSFYDATKNSWLVSLWAQLLGTVYVNKTISSIQGSKLAVFSRILQL